jgi:arsenate reductase-like glutaredoxin family protein
MTCKKAREFLETNQVKVVQEVDATKDRKGRDEALALAKNVEKVMVAKGQKIITFDMIKDPPENDMLAAFLLGPTGNLRAPTVRKGKTLLVGFNVEAYEQELRG